MELGKRHRGVKGVRGEKGVHGGEGAHGENPQAPQGRGEALGESVTSVAGTSAEDPGASAAVLVLEAFAFQEAAAGLRVWLPAMGVKD